jgi:diguanylate cyclase
VTIDPAARRPDASQAGDPLRPTVSMRTSPASLIGLLARAAGQARPGIRALLVVRLNRSDRLQALAQDPSNPAILAEVARRVQATLKPADRYAFVSNEEIWIVLEHSRDAGAADQTTRTLRDVLQRPIQVDAQDCTVSVRARPAIGGAWAPERVPTDALRLVEQASSACRRAGSRDDRVLVTRIADPSVDRDLGSLGGELRLALRDNQLDVHFQPQIDLRAGQCAGAEALIRWKRGNATSVAPPLIASLCEELGLTRQLTQFVLHSALRHQNAWKRQGLDLAVSVNLSVSTISDPDFPIDVEEALRTWQVPAGRLTLELTEAAIASDEALALAFMKRIRQIGCAVAIDDFGTGYSSFTWLQRYPIDEIKIDRSFVRALDSAQEEVDRRTVHALIGLAHAFGMRALAEAVETRRAADDLLAAGCDRAQGHHFCAAMPGHQLVDWCRQHRESRLLSGSEDNGIR